MPITKKNEEQFKEKLTKYIISHSMLYRLCYSVQITATICENLILVCKLLITESEYNNKKTKKNRTINVNIKVSVFHKSYED